MSVYFLHKYNIYIYILYILYAAIIFLDLGEPFTLRSFSLHHRIIAADRSASSSASLVRLKLSAWIDVAVRS